MKHNGGLEFRKISNDEYEFKTEIQDYHINSGMGTASHQVIEWRAVTIILNTNFIGGSKAGDKIIGLAKIKKKTHSLIFMNGHLKCEDKLLASAEGIWKII